MYLDVNTDNSKETMNNYDIDTEIDYEDIATPILRKHSSVPLVTKVSTLKVN